MKDSEHLGSQNEHTPSIVGIFDFLLNCQKPGSQWKILPYLINHNINLNSPFTQHSSDCKFLCKAIMP